LTIDFTSTDTLIETFEQLDKEGHQQAWDELNHALRHHNLDGVTYCVALSIKNELEE
jgi:hypothetical protein